MPEIVEYKKATLEVIKRQIKILNGSVLLIICALLFLVVRFTYIILDYIPASSITAILLIVAGLVVLGAYLANSASKTAIKKIDEYSDKLNILLISALNIRNISYGDVLLDNIVDSSLKLTGADAGSILLSENNRLVYKIVKGNESRNLSGLSIPKSLGIAGWVVDNNSAIRVDNVKNDSRFNPEVDKITSSEINSVLCVPLRLSSGTIGALELVNKKDSAFSSEDLDIVSYFADQAAISISMVKFHEEQKVFEIHLTDILLDAMDSILPEKRGHSKRVAKYTLLMAHALNMSDDEKKRLYRASLLHDIGFLKMRTEEIFSKEEYKAHSQIAFEMLKPINFYADITSIILYHHERYDGKGYPSGQRGKLIPLESRMIAIAEAFDAMVSRNSYKCTGKMINEDVKSSICGFSFAIEELKNNVGTQFDPELVEIFVKNIDKDYVDE